MMIKECRSFAGLVDFVSIFCPELQGLLKLLYDLTRKGRHFVWGEKQQKAFEEIKSRLKRPLVFTYQTDMDDSNCTQTQASLLLVVHCTKFRMARLNSCLHE